MKKLVSTLIITLSLCASAAVKPETLEKVADNTATEILSDRTTQPDDTQKQKTTPDGRPDFDNLDADELLDLLAKNGVNLDVVYEDPSWLTIKGQQLLCKIAEIPGVLWLALKIKNLLERIQGEQEDGDADTATITNNADTMGNGPVEL